MMAKIPRYSTSCLKFAFTKGSQETLNEELVVFYLDSVMNFIGERSNKWDLVK